MNRALEKFRQFMYNRNGFDKLTLCLMIIYLLVNGISSMIMQPAVRYSLKGVAVLIVLFAVYRVLSKNVYRRQYEEAQFEKLIDRTNYKNNFNKIRMSFKHLKIRMKQIKTHRFRVCPSCGEFLRISKKRGKRNITCPKCGNAFETHIFF